MSGRVFLDTNVFVYELEISEPKKSAQAEALIRSSIKARRGVVSYQVVQEFFNVAFKKFAKPLSVMEAEEYLRKTFVPLLAVDSSPRLFREAIRIKNQHRLSWYDALIVAAAVEAQCEILYSEDLQSGRKFEGVTIQNPFLSPPS
jgi:predicted nucleic acid-binding protein